MLLHVYQKLTYFLLVHLLQAVMMWRNLAVCSKSDNEGKAPQKKENYFKYQKKTYA